MFTACPRLDRADQGTMDHEGSFEAWHPQGWKHKCMSYAGPRPTMITSEVLNTRSGIIKLIVPRRADA
jgi:hypothetical protein